MHTYKIIKVTINKNIQHWNHIDIYKRKLFFKKPLRLFFLSLANFKNFRDCLEGIPFFHPKHNSNVPTLVACLHQTFYSILAVHCLVSSQIINCMTCIIGHSKTILERFLTEFRCKNE